MSVHINDLPCELLEKIFSFLPFDHRLFRLELVCQKWKSSISLLLIMKIELQTLNHFGNKFKINQPFFTGYSKIDDHNIDIVKKILSKCPNIKYLNLERTHIYGSNNLSLIAKLCPKLERINLDFSEINVTEDEMDEFGMIIGPKLIQGNFDSYNFVNYINTIFKHLKNLETIKFKTYNKSETQTTFQQLDLSCANLQTLEWVCYEESPWEFNENVMNVLQKISHLKIHLNNLKQFETIKMDNLTELTVDEYTSWAQTLSEMTFHNLTKLNIRFDEYHHFALISKLNFPKLNSVCIYNNDYHELPSSFINQIKNIKKLYLECNFVLVPFLQLLELIDFQCDFVLFTKNDDSFTKFVQCFDILAKHKSLENIKLTIYDDRFDLNIFDKIVFLGQSKPSAIIEIKIHKRNLSDDNFIKFNLYKKLVEDAKSLTKLNLKLFLLDD